MITKFHDLKKVIGKLYRDESYREYILIYFLRGFSVLSAFMLNIFLSNIFGPNEFGIYAVISSSIMIASVFCRFGTDTLSLRYIPNFINISDIRNIKKFHSYSIVVISVISTILMISTLVYVYIVYYNTKLFYIYLVGIFIVPVYSLLYNYTFFLLAMKEFIYSQSLFGIIRPLIIALLCLLFYFAMNDHDAIYIVASDIISTIIVCVACYFLFISKLSNKNETVNRIVRSKVYLKEGFSMTIISSAQLILARSDVVIVGIILGPQVAGLYFAASQLSGIVKFFIQSAEQVLAPNISRIYYSDKRRGLQKYISKTVIFLCAITIPVILLILYFGKFLLSLYGDEFIETYNILIVLSLSNFIIVFFGPVGFLLSMTGQHRVASLISVLSASMNIILSIILIPLYGPIGAAASLFLSVGFRCLGMSIVVWRKIEVASTPFGPVLIALFGNKP